MDKKIVSVQYNPLADYKAQIKQNYKECKKKVGETSLSSSIHAHMGQIPDDMEISYLEDMGSFDYSKVVTTAAFRNTILKTSPCTQSLFLWIIFRLKYRSDTIEIDPDKVKALGLSLSKNSLVKAISELESINLIKRQGNKRLNYWIFNINPQCIFKGDAKKFYNEVVKAHPEYLKKY
jgi:hypothetical protein